MLDVRGKTFSHTLAPNPTAYGYASTSSAQAIEGSLIGNPIKMRDVRRHVKRFSISPSMTHKSHELKNLLLVMMLLLAIMMMMTKVVVGVVKTRAHIARSVLRGSAWLAAWPLVH